MKVVRWILVAGLFALATPGLAAAQSAAPAPDRKAPPADAGKAAANKKPAAVETPKEPKELTAEEPECAWVGKRVTGLLARDDVQAASEFLKFYAMFHCPAPHLGLAFRCTVRNGGASDAAATDRVERCWHDPTVRFFPHKPDGSAAKPAPKNSDKYQPPK